MCIRRVVRPVTVLGVLSDTLKGAQDAVIVFVI